MQGIWDSIKSLGKSIVDGLTSALKTLFIPREGFFNNTIEELMSALKDKMPFIEQVQIAFKQFLDTFNNAGTDVPKFTFTYKGMVLNVIDFTWFAQYRPIVHGIIIFCSYFLYFRKLLKSIPGLIGGFYG